MKIEEEKRRIVRKIIVLLLLFGFIGWTGRLPAEAAAPTTTPLAAAINVRSLDQEVSATDLNVLEPGFWSSMRLTFGLWRAKLFKDQAGVLSVERSLAAQDIVRANRARGEGNIAEMLEHLARYETHIATLQEKINAVLGSSKEGADPKVVQVLDEILRTRPLELSALHNIALDPGAARYLLTIRKIQRQALKKLAVTLAHETNPVKRAENLTKITEKLAKKETQADRKFILSADLLSALEFATDDDDTAAQIGEALDDVIEAETKTLQAEKFDDDLNEVADRTEDLFDEATETENIEEAEHRAAVLTTALRVDAAQIPVALRAMLQNYLDTTAAQLATLLAAEPTQVNNLLQGQTVPSIALENRGLTLALSKVTNETARAAIIVALERKATQLQRKLAILSGNIDVAERVLKRLEKYNKELLEQAVKNDEKITELQEKIAERGRERSQQQEESSSSGSGEDRSATPTATQREGQTYTAEFDDGTIDLDRTTIRVGDTIRFRNKEDFAIVLYSNPHPLHHDHPALNHGTIAKDGEWSYTFTTAGSYGFHDHNRPSITATITVTQ